MNNLIRYKFSDLYDMASGLSSKPAQAGHGAPFLSFSAVFNNYFLPDELADQMDTSEVQQVKYSICEGDIFLTRTSEVIDELGMSSVSLKDYHGATYSGFLKRLRPKKVGLTYPKFMAFYLRSPLFRKAMENNAVLTLRASLNEEIFSYLELLLPEYSEQVRIGDFLYSINQKIDCNNRMGVQLHAMAKTLYDYWFLQFDFPDANGNPYKSSGGRMLYNSALDRAIPEGWGDGSLWDIARYFNGLAMQKYRPTGSDFLPVIKIREMGEGISKNSEKARPDIPAGAIVEDGDVLFSWSATLDVKVWSQGVGALNQHIFKVTSDKYPKTFYYFELLAYLEHFKMMADKRKTTMGHITQDHLKQSKICIPPDDLILEAHKQIAPILEKRLNHEKENSKLTKLRDWLLPMLINGQLTIK